MGTDIHAVVQKKTELGWVVVPTEWDTNRHYGLFAHLAGVRNGRGFAGCVIGDAVRPIAEPRGLPEDMLASVCIDSIPIPIEEAESYELDDNPTNPHRWLGDHSHSWLGGEEILAHDWTQGRNSGIIPIEQYQAWEPNTEPDSYSGDVWGGGIVVAETPEEITDATTHVRVWWDKTAEEFAYFTDEIRRLRDEHGEIRVVFGFDS